MTDARTRDIGPLTWVKSEIEQALNKAKESINLAREGKEQASQLQFAQTHLHQASGALSIISLDGLTQFTGQIEKLLGQLARGERAAEDAHYDLLLRALATTCNYLEELAHGTLDQPLRLFPLYSELVAATEQRNASHAELFFPDTSLRPPRNQVRVFDLSEERRQHAIRMQRGYYQTGLVKVLRGQQERIGISEMLDAARRLEPLHDRPAANALWWAAQALFEAMLSDDVKLVPPVKRVCAGLEKELGREAHHQSSVPDRLMRELLYFIAIAPARSSLQQAVHATWHLSEQIPEDGARVSDVPLAPLLKSLRNEIGLAKRAWDDFSNGKLAALPVFDAHLQKLHGEALVLGRPMLNRLLEGMFSFVQWLRRDPRPIDYSVALEVAAAQLLIENALREGAPDANFGIQVRDTLTRLAAITRGDPLPRAEASATVTTGRRVEEREALSQVAREIRTSLSHIEQRLDDFFRNQGKRAPLAELSGPIKQIEGALMLVDDADATELVQEIGAQIDAFATEQEEGDEIAFKALAHKLSALGFYIQALEYSPARLADFLNPRHSRDTGADADAPLGPTIAPSDTTAPQTFPTLGDTTPPPIATPAPPEATADTTPAAAESAPPSVEPEPSPAVEPEPVAPEPATAPAPAAFEAVEADDEDTSELDAELLEIFLEEANEVLATIAENLPVSRANPADTDTLTTIRRGFHTLKGSGRMVGLKALGDASWEVEQTLNHWLQLQLEPTPALHDFIAEATDFLTEWAEAIAAGDHRNRDASALAATGEHLRDPEAAEAPSSAAPAPTAADTAAAEVAEIATPVAKTSGTAPFRPAQDSEDDFAFTTTNLESTTLGFDLSTLEDDPVSISLEETVLGADALNDLDRDDAPATEARTELRTEPLDIADLSLDFDDDEPPTLLPDDFDAAPERAKAMSTADEVEQMFAELAETGRLAADTDEDDTSFATLLTDADHDDETRAQHESASAEPGADLLTLDLQALAEHDTAALQPHDDALDEPADAPVEAATEEPAPALTTEPPAAEELEPAEDTAAPAAELPAEERAVEEAAIEEVPVEEALTEETATAEDLPAEEAPVEEAAAAETPIEEIRLEDLATEETPAEEAQVEEITIEEVQVEELVAEDVAAEDVAAEDVAAEDVAAEDVAAEDVAAEELLAEELLAEETTAEDALAIAAADDVTPEVASPPTEPAPAEEDASLAAGAALTETEPETEPTATGRILPLALRRLLADEAAPAEPEPESGSEIPPPVAEAVTAEEEHDAPAITAAAAEEVTASATPPAAPASTDAAAPQNAKSEKGIDTDGYVDIGLLADAFATPPEEPTPAQTSDDTALLEALEISRPLLDLYLSEALQHIERLRSDFAELGQPPHKVASSSLRAAHTLAGISGTTRIFGVHHLARGLELALERAQAAEQDLTAKEVELVGTAIDQLVAMRETVARGLLPDAATEIEQRLEAIGKSQIAATAAPAAPAATHPDTPAAAAAAVSPLPKDEIDDQLLPLFLEEGADLIAAIHNDLRAWRAAPDSSEPRQSLARLLHTLKGSARMTGIMSLGDVVHQLESQLEDGHEAETPVSELVETITAGIDRAQLMLDRVASGQPAVPSTPATPVAADEEAPASVAAAPVVQIADDAAGTPHADSTALIRVRANIIDRMVNEAGEIGIARTRIDGELRTLRRSLLDLTENVIRLRNQLREVEIQADLQLQSRTVRTDGGDEEFDPLEMDRYTRLQELTRLLAEGVGDVTTVQQNLLNNIDNAELALHSQARLSRDLQESLMQIRLVPFDTLTDRLYRIVRQSAKELGKRVNLDIRNGHIEIDRSVLEHLNAALGHLLRNAITHGIETAEMRRSHDKSDTGQITINLGYQGNEIAVTVSDDGQGLNFAKIEQRARDRGLLTPDEAVDQYRLTNMIFAAGFSTEESVSELSGRGVGMDVVKAEIATVGGRIDVVTTPGEGTTFRIFLPITLAQTQAVLVEAAGGSYAIPSNLITQVLEIKAGTMHELLAQGGTEWSGERYYYRYLPHLLGDIRAQPEINRFNWIILLQAGEQRMALHVDHLRGNQEIIVKQAGPHVLRVTGISGATVLGDGEVVLILNPVALTTRSLGETELFLPVPQPAELLSAAQEQRDPLVMVVDDSLTVRKITSRMLEREGFQVITAKDGTDALEKLLDNHPDVILSDIEMPRMDGFDLVRNIRADQRLQDIPIIMITSRLADKHREHATRIGANHYLGKPYVEDELLGLIRSYTD